MPCPLHGEVQRLIYDSQKCATRSNPYRDFADGLPHIIPYGAPPVTRAVAHCMLAYHDNQRMYYLYTKCLYAEDLIMICNALISTRAASRLRIYECNQVEHLRPDYVDLAYVILFEGLAPAFTMAEQLTNFYLYFRQMVEARGYVFRRYYDDRDADLPVTSHTPWRPRIPKGARGWDDILNLPFRI